MKSPYQNLLGLDCWLESKGSLSFFLGLELLRERIDFVVSLEIASRCSVSAFFTKLRRITFGCDFLITTRLHSSWSIQHFFSYFSPLLTYFHRQKVNHNSKSNTFRTQRIICYSLHLSKTTQFDLDFLASVAMTPSGEAKTILILTFI